MKINQKKYLFYTYKATILVFLIYFLFSIASVIYAFHNDLKISPALQAQIQGLHKKEPGKYNIAIISPERLGEKNQSEMLYKAAEKKGYPAYLYKINDTDMDVFIISRILNNLLVHTLNYLLDIDFTIAISFHVNLDITGPKMMYVSIPPLYFARGVKERYYGVNYYDHFLDINLINRSDDWLSPILNKKVITSYGMVGFPASNYKPSSHQKLLMYGSLWGRKSKAIDFAINKLAEQNYMYLIQSPFLSLDKQEVIKFVEEKKTTEDLLRVLNEYGIALCIHSIDYHLAEGIPSSRIFEIVSSGAIAISDMNPFVIKYFGDSVLYFDQNLSGEEIFKQIDSHVKWVQQNPKKAEEMAQKAHKILQENFTTERFVEDMVKFYETKIRKT